MGFCVYGRSPDYIIAWLVYLLTFPVIAIIAYLIAWLVKI